ncbi:GntR family transcriptional regulator [Streptomyces sp. NPDC059994]|uniref:GntR family transcriptional regulator n=1 Tax=Streptomyces sp. NPDC059994 TaxID=3347029 RepID=UPI00367E88FC
MIKQRNMRPTPIPCGSTGSQGSQSAVASTAGSFHTTTGQDHVPLGQTVETSDPPLTGNHRHRHQDLVPAIHRAVRLLCDRITHGTDEPLTADPAMHVLAASLEVPLGALHHAVLYLKAAGILCSPSGMVCDDAPARIAALAAGSTLSPHERAHPQDRRCRSVRLADRIQADIAAGRWPHEPAHTLRSLAGHYQVPRDVLIVAVRTLREKGVLDVRPWVGVRIGSTRPGLAQRRTGTTLTHSCYTLIKERIEQGTYPAGSRLPSHLMLATEFGVSATTVAAALRLLREEALVTRHQGAAHVTQTHPPRRSDGALASLPVPEHLAAVDRAVQLLSTRITDGTYPPLTVTPPLVELAGEFGVPTVALSQAVRRLRKKGVLTSYRGGQATIAADAAAQLTQRAAAPRPAGATASQVRQGIPELAARMRHDISEYAWPEGQFRTRRDLHVRYQVPDHVAAGAVELLKEEQILETRRRVGARPLPAAPQRPEAWLGKELTLAGGVEAAIRARIDDRTYPPGTSLRSTAIAAEFGVSRATVGTALRRLREMHVIEGRAQRTRVSQLARTGPAGQPASQTPVRPPAATPRRPVETESAHGLNLTTPTGSGQGSTS